MARITDLTVEDFKQRINTFNKQYVLDWNNWLVVSAENKPRVFGEILRSWQACRPNTMRREKDSDIKNLHDAPYLDDLIYDASSHVQQLESLNFDIRNYQLLSDEKVKSALISLWLVFKKLSYEGKAHNGLAGAVGISKAVMLITNGKVGPAFDSRVKKFLNVDDPITPQQWIDRLKLVSKDIYLFEKKHGVTIIEATPTDFQNLNIGRIYDMALGPR